MPLILYIRIEFAAEKAESIASLFLRHTKRGIRVLDQHFGIFSISGKDAYSDARARVRACVPVCLEDGLLQAIRHKYPIGQIG